MQIFLKDELIIIMNIFKNIIPSILLIQLTISLSAQLLVSTDPQQKNAVLEEFTGIHCGNCPDGHAIAQEIIENNPYRAVVISIHQGNYAIPVEGEPDYRTQWGDPIAEQAGVIGYPMGTVNRHLFNGTNTAMSRGDWIASADQIMNEPSPVNIGVQSIFDSVSRELNITVELYYTEDSPLPANKLNIALLQNHVFGPQLGGNSGNEYEHMHMLRDLTTGQWGEEINSTTQGSFIQKEYVYVVPEQINDIPIIVEDCEVAVFVSETHQEIYTGAVVHAVDGTNLYVGNVSISDTVQVKKGNTDEITSFMLTTKSALEGEEEFLFTLETINKPDDWDVSFDYDGQTYIDTAIILLEQDSSEQISFQIKPGTTAEMVEFVFKMKSINYPEAPEKYIKFNVISGVTDLIVNGTGGPESGYYDYVFSEGLESAACKTYSTISANLFVQGMHDRAFNEINNVYLNIAWTFPALTIEQIHEVKEFMNGGGNLLISGQDIGWDFMSGASNSHGSPEATDFYENYLFSNYLNDGTSVDNIIYANQDDEVYSGVPDAFLIDIYNGNMYPDNISARDGADEVFYYQLNDKAAAVKKVTDKFKVIYFGIGIEMIGLPFITDKILRQTYYWFNNSLSTEEYENSMSGLFIEQNKPNPANQWTIIPLSLENNGELKLFNLEGKEIRSMRVNKGTSEIKLDLDGLKPGIYLYRIISGEQSSELKKLTVF